MPPATTKIFVPQLPRLFESFRLKVFHLKSRAAQGFCRSAHRRASFRRDRRAAVVFEITDSQFSDFIFTWPAHRNRRGAGVANVWALHHFEKNFQVGNGARHRADDADQCKRPGGYGKVAGRGNSSWSWLQAADAAEVRGHANRASTVAAHSARGHARGNRCRFAAAGTAGRALQIPWAVGAAIEQVVGFPRHQKFGRVGYAQNNCAGILQPRHQRSILRRDKSCAQPGSGLATHSRHAMNS